jgi:hypothetical protein
MLIEPLQLNVPQQIFTLFFAITWGTAANSQPRWKAFAWGAFFDSGPARWRILLSVVVLNVLPLCYFALVLWCLGHGGWTGVVQWNFKADFIILLSTIPALAPFGFYRIWTGLVARSNMRFYGVESPWFGDRPDQLTRYGITLDPPDLNPVFAWPNLVWGLIYVSVGLIIAFGGRCF